MSPLALKIPWRPSLASSQTRLVRRFADVRYSFHLWFSSSVDKSLSLWFGGDKWAELWIDCNGLSSTCLLLLHVIRCLCPWLRFPRSWWRLHHPRLRPPLQSLPTYLLRTSICPHCFLIPWRRSPSSSHLPHHRLRTELQPHVAHRPSALLPSRSCL